MNSALQRKHAVLRLARLLTLLAFVSPCLAASTAALAEQSAPKPATPQSTSALQPAPIRFWNRTIALQRVNVAGAGPELRSKHASNRLLELPLGAKAADVQVKPVKIEDQDGVAFVYNGRFLFFLGTNDLDRESGETLDQAAKSTLDHLDEALQARAAERSWPVIRNGVLYTVVGFVILLALIAVMWNLQAGIIRFLRKREGFTSFRIFRIDLLPHLFVTAYTLIRVVSWCLISGFIYLWGTISLRSFPYTEPWGRQAGGYVLNALGGLGAAVLRSIPDLLVVVLIFLLTRWLARMIHLFFDPLTSGRLTISWMDSDVARATQRIVIAVLWVFALIFAYPYIPGSRTEAFKGLSVFLGLVISLGSTGIINQVMSGLFVVYSKALKTGEWVKVDKVEGEVLEVGLLAAKVRTIEGQEVTIPHSVLVGTSTTNFTRLGHAEGMTISPTVGIGYDTPWRQVHVLLVLAAERTSNIRQTPKPYVVQRSLSDFNVEYTLVAHLERESLRIPTISQLHSAIQDVFNEAGVQIMSPHYMLQPKEPVVVPREKWNPQPSADEPDKSR